MSKGAYIFMISNGDNIINQYPLRTYPFQMTRFGRYLILKDSLGVDIFDLEKRIIINKHIAKFANICMLGFKQIMFVNDNK